MIWRLIDVDIPQLTSSGIDFDTDCFRFTYSLQSTSTHTPISSSFDAAGLENYINFGKQEPTVSSTVIRNRTELNSIPLDVEDLWIGRFDTSDVSEFTPNRFKSLKTLVIGNGTFWSVNRLELNNLTCLEMLYIGDYAFQNTGSFEMSNLTSLVSIEFGQWCFGGYEDNYGTTHGGASSFSLIGIIE